MEPLPTADRLVVKAISAITAALSKEGISKDRKNQQQNYSFRGIEDIYAALSPLLAINNVVILTNVEERHETVRESKSGGAIYSVALKVRFTFCHATDNSQVDVTVWGEAMDSADKATNKAMSAAYKYMAFMTFCIPVEGQDDADHDTPAPSRPAAKPFQVRATAKPAPAPIVVADLAEPYELVEEAVTAIHASLTEADLQGTMARIRASKFQGEDLKIAQQAWKERQKMPVRSV